MYDVATLIIVCKPTYKTRRRPITARIAGTRITNTGTIGITFSMAYEESIGGVTNGNENKIGKFSIPRVFPSMNSIAAKPNIMFTKNAPNSRTLVICQITNCSGLNL